jgi:hypothetical protein
MTSGTWRWGLALAAVVAFWGRSVAANSFMYGGHSYLVVEENRTWLEAALDAATRQVAGSPGYLAIIDSQGENDAIFDQLLVNVPPADFNKTRAPDGGNGVYAWIGASDRITEGQWIWDGTGAGAGTLFWQGTGNGGGNVVGGLYNNWGHDPRNPQQQWEPDNAVGGLQDAAGMGLADWPRGFAREWNDVRADNRLYYIVEFDAVPEPATWALALVAALGLALARRGVGSAVRTRCGIAIARE